MKKRVNIRPTFPIYCLRPPITGYTKNIELSTGDISRCICARALVDEILEDGSTVRLTLSNYNKDNSKKSQYDKTEQAPVQTKPEVKSQINTPPITPSQSNNKSSQSTDDKSKK